MSSIGKNIRKIRTIKGLSQSAFANLFNLTRASISAYEEARAEPKMDATLEIAKYFNIPIETLLSHEITVNEFAKFNLQDFISGGLENENKTIPVVSAHNWSQFLKEGVVSEFPEISFPSSFLQGDIAFVVNEHINSNYHSGTVLICKTEKSVSDNAIYLSVERGQAAVVHGGELHLLKGAVVYRLMQTIEEVNSARKVSMEERLIELERRVVSLEQDK